jgi:hypothetical protein
MMLPITTFGCVRGTPAEEDHLFVELSHGRPDYLARFGVTTIKAHN